MISARLLAAPLAALALFAAGCGDDDSDTGSSGTNSSTTPAQTETTETPQVPFIAQQLEKHAGPVIASTDYMKNYCEQVRPFLPKGRAFKVLGTDGFGRSDFRSKLREHFEVNRHYVVVAALKALADDGVVPAAKVAEAIKKYGIKADKINPLYA